MPSHGRHWKGSNSSGSPADERVTHLTQNYETNPLSLSSFEKALIIKAAPVLSAVFAKQTKLQKRQNGFVHFPFLVGALVLFILIPLSHSA